MGCTTNDYEPTGNKIYVIGNTNPISNKVMLAGVVDAMRPYSSNRVNVNSLYSLDNPHTGYQMNRMSYDVKDLAKNMNTVDSKVYDVGEKISDVSERISRLELSNDLLREHVGKLENLLEQLTANIKAVPSKRTIAKAYPVIYDGLAAIVEEVPENVMPVDFSRKQKKKAA